MLFDTTSRMFLKLTNQFTESVMETLSLGKADLKWIKLSKYGMVLGYQLRYSFLVRNKATKMRVAQLLAHEAEGKEYKILVGNPLTYRPPGRSWTAQSCSERGSEARNGTRIFVIK